MGHYAKVRGGVVVEVIVADADFISSYVDNTPGNWIKTSYNTRGGIHYEPADNTQGQFQTQSADQTKALRYNFAGIGYIYDEDADAFYSPQPFESWTLNTTTYIWDAPLSYPTDGQRYRWDESAYQADNSTGWVLDS